MLPFDWSHTIEAALHHVELSCRLGPPLRLGADKPYAHFVQRARFDNLLLEKAIEAGGEVRQGALVKEIEVHGEYVEVQTSHGTFRSSVLVGADGANSVVARSLNLFDKQRGIAIDAEVYVPDAVYRRFQDTVYLSYGDPVGGYGWVFPKGDHLSVGVGTFYSKREPLQEPLDRLLAHLDLAEYRIEKFGHPIPDGGRPRTIHTQRALLVGDAAGLNDPLSGEGIAHAVSSGAIAATHISSALGTGDFSFDAYQRHIDREIRSELRRAAWIAHKMYRYPRIFHWLFQRNPDTVALYFRLVAGEIGYVELVDHLRKQFLRFKLFADDQTLPGTVER